MKAKQRKTVKVMTGTEIPICSPSHPYSAAVQIRRILDRIVGLPESEFEYACNVPAGIEVFEKYGRWVLDLNILYFINGAKATYKDVVEDMERSSNYIDTLIANKDESN